MLGASCAQHLRSEWVPASANPISRSRDSNPVGGISLKRRLRQVTAGIATNPRPRCAFTLVNPSFTAPCHFPHTCSSGVLICPTSRGLPNAIRLDASARSHRAASTYRGCEVQSHIPLKTPKRRTSPATCFCFYLPASEDTGRGKFAVRASNPGARLAQCG